MKNCLPRFVWFLAVYAYPCLGDTVYKPSAECLGCPEQIVIETRLAQAIEIRECKGISGMTCRIIFRPNAAAVPSEIFVQELGSKGQKLGRPFRLIYPDLKKGETGWATFRFLRGGELSYVRLTARWDGPWKNPY